MKLLFVNKKRFLLSITIFVILFSSVFAATSSRAATICSPATAISGLFTKDGAGDFCWSTTSLCSYINSWNLTTLEVNGTAYTNIYSAASAIAPVNGLYTIHYNSAVAWGHFEMGGTCGGVSPTNTPLPAATNTPVTVASATRTNTPVAATATSTPVIAATATRTNTPIPATNTPVTASTVRIEAGGIANYTDASGNVWLADTGFTAGAGGVADRGTGLAIANTTNDRIYQTERWGMTAFAYTVPNGTYTVNLHLAETYWTAAGQRVFSANVEGAAINNIDVFAQAGGMNTALVKSVCVNVADGQLNMTFTASVDNAEINGIEIIPATNCPTATPAPTATRTSTPAAVSGVAISANLVGANYWWYQPSTTVWTLTGQIGLKTVRIGGIAFDDTPIDNATLATYVSKIKAINAAPMVQVSRYASAASAAAVVSYFNGTNGSNGASRVQFWNIGNEPHCTDGWTDAAAIADIASYTKSLSTAMKAVDPTITIYATDLCAYKASILGALFKGDNSSNDISGKVPGKTYYYVDGLSWHTYTGFESPKITVDQLTTTGASEFENNAYNTSLLLNAANTAQNRTGASALKWGVGEFNDDRGEMTCSFEDGQMFGQAYGSFMKYGATYATAWSLAEGGSNCAASTSDRGIINENTGKPRSSYYHMQMVAQNFSGIYLNGTSNLTNMRTYGAYDAGANRIAVMLMNIDKTATNTCTVRLNSDAVTGACQVNIPAGVAVSYSKAIGPQTTVVLIFNLQGQLTKTITYSKSGNWTQDVAPSVTIP